MLRKELFRAVRGLANRFTAFMRARKLRAIACLGYALFLATNASVTWGGFFPFLPYEFQTPTVLNTFFMAQSFAFALTFFASAIGSYRLPRMARLFFVKMNALPYVFGWVCLIAALYVSERANTLVLLGGVLVGVGTAGFFMVWQRLLAAKKASEGNIDLIVGTLLAPVIYFALYLVPVAVTSLLIPFVFMPLFSLCSVLTSREVDLDQPMFLDQPSDHPRVYRTAIKDYWRSALSIGSLAFSCGIVRSLALDSPDVGSVVNAVSMAALFICSGALLIIWRSKPLQINISSLVRLFFPFAVTAFVLMPILKAPYVSVLAAALYALYGCSLAVVMMQCAQASRDRSINPVFIYGFVAGVIYLFHDLGFIGGKIVGATPFYGLDAYISAAVLSIYILAIMFFLEQGGFKAALSPGHVHVDRVELFTTSASSHRSRPSATKAPAALPTEPEPQLGYSDKTAKQCALLRAHFKLSERETEIVESLARGSTAPSIAKSLGVSENTVKTHMKRIYSKLGIHRKGELIDLVNSFDPKALA